MLLIKPFLMAAYQSENWTFLPDSQTLVFANGHSEQLPPRLNALLLSLVSADGKTVSYEQLLQEVWGTTHKDASTISSVVSEVRKLVGCGKNGNKIIATIPKRGYRFVLPVTAIENDKFQQTLERQTPNRIVPELLAGSKDTFAGQLDAQLNSPQIKKTSTIYKTKWLWVVVTASMAVVAYLIYSALKPVSPSTAPNALGSYEVLTHEQGTEDEFDISNDGSWLTYVNKTPKNQSSLLVKEVATGRTEKITAADYYFGSPVFSRDSRKIVFHKQTAHQCEVWLADFSQFKLDENKTEKLTNCGKSGFWSTLAFSADGNHIYFSRANALTDPYKVYRLDLRTKFERGITSPTSSGRGDYAFSLSPSGQQLAVVRNVLWQESHILLGSPQGGQSETIFQLPYLIDRVAWLNEEQLIYCDKSEAIWSFNLITKQHLKLGNTDFSCVYPVVSQQMLFAIKKIRLKNAIWSLTMGPDSELVMQPLIDSPYYDFNAMEGPNGSWYFMSNRSGDEQLWQKTEQGFEQYRDIELPENARELAFSVETNSVYGIAEQRLFRYDLSLGELAWLSTEKHEVFNFSISTSSQLIFSEGNNEYWTLKSLDLYTLRIADLNINAFSVKQAKDVLYYTKFHEKGLWKKNLNTGTVEKVSEHIDVKFNTFWDIWQGKHLIWATDNKFKIYDLNTGQLTSEQLEYEGHVGYLKCSDARAMCTFSLRENDESEVIRFKTL